MIKLMQLLRNLLLIFLFASIIQGCDGTETYHLTSNYFPLNEHSQWEYQWQYGCDCPEKYGPPTAPMILKVTGDTILNGKTYSKIETEQGALKMVRKAG